MRWLRVKVLCYIDAMGINIKKTSEIGAAISQRRKELGLTQEQLAEAAGVSYQQMQRYENGGSMINVENVQRIARALSIHVTVLFENGRVQEVAEPSSPSKEEKTLLRYFRELSAKSDKQLAISVIRRFAKK